MIIELKHRAHPLTRTHIGLALPSGEVTHLRGLLAERLAALALPAPVIALRLRSGALLAAMPANGWLWKQAQSHETIDALPRLIERLRARLGNDRVFGVHAVEDHRPECAWRIGGGNASLVSRAAVKSDELSSVLCGCWHSHARLRAGERNCEGRSASRRVGGTAVK